MDWNGTFQGVSVNLNPTDFGESLDFSCKAQNVRNNHGGFYVINSDTHILLSWTGWEVPQHLRDSDEDMGARLNVSPVPWI